MPWEVECTDQFVGWFEGLEETNKRRVVAAVEIVEEDGPSTGRPIVDSIAGSRHSNLKELRAGTIRILFAFDPRRVAILLLGGDKHGEWTRWYGRAVPEADGLYDEHVSELKREGLI